MSTVGVSSASISQHDLPAPRFGHSTTLIGPNSVILFGGAVGDTGHYQITNECYHYNLTDKTWSKLEAENPPRARAAHGAARVDTMQMVIYGGATGGGTLSTEELYLLDCRKFPKTISWMTVPISGPTPGRRYGHSMNYYKPNLIVFGGNNGQQSLNDIWYMDVVQSPFLWNQVHIPPGDKKPPERVYHSADVCRDGPANGMLVIFGGRTTNNEPMKDVWGLRQHRDLSWDWVAAPVKKGSLPEARFQHSAVFIGTKMFVVGGREQDVSKMLSTAMYDTETCEWKSLPGVERFRHASWAAGTQIYTFGGFDHQTQTHPTDNLQVMDAL
ncbi:serine/threonine-protein phosphatase, partial [Gregarina niphandrodes]